MSHEFKLLPYFNRSITSQKLLTELDIDTAMLDIKTKLEENGITLADEAIEAAKRGVAITFTASSTQDHIRKLVEPHFLVHKKTEQDPAALAKICPTQFLP